MFHVFLFFPKHLSQTHLILTTCMFCKYECAYGPNDHHNDPTHVRSKKWKCLATIFNQSILRTTQCGGAMFFTIKHKLEQRVNLHMTKRILNYHLACHGMLSKYHNLWKITFGGHVYEPYRYLGWFRFQRWWWRSCHLTHESYNINNPKHLIHKGKWIIAPTNVVTSCRWWFKVFDS
jgi:hypothetical protein